jgi:hypothetical protein
LLLRAAVLLQLVLLLLLLLPAGCVCCQCCCCVCVCCWCFANFVKSCWRNGVPACCVVAAVLLLLLVMLLVCVAAVVLLVLPTVGCFRLFFFCSIGGCRVFKMYFVRVCRLGDACAKPVILALYCSIGRTYIHVCCPDPQAAHQLILLASQNICVVHQVRFS